ncbi:MAG: glycosyltransferase family 4 protein [Desulfomonile tiedjei]|nr:glycosyltransferase family 4 protein [Desulfomonile tiedjei]
MKIAVDCRMIQHGGIGTVLRELLPLLLRSNHRFVLLGDSTHLRAYANLDAEIWPFREPIYSISEQMRYPRRALRGVDVLLHPHYNVPVRPSVPVVVVIHDLAPLALPDLFSGPAKRLYAHMFFRLAVRGSARVIADSHFTKQEIVERLAADPASVRVIHLGPGRTFSSEADVTPEALGRYGIAAPYVLSVGNLKPHKNLRKLVEAFVILKQRRHSPLGLVIAGQAFSDTGRCEELLGLSRGELRQKGVTLPGFVRDEDMPALYHDASLLLLPSVYEGFGLTPLEALRFGTLPLVANAASLPEVLDDPELRFDPVDAEAMAEKMALFLDDPDLRATKIAAQRKRIDRFSWHVTAQKYLEVLEDVGARPCS